MLSVFHAAPGGLVALLARAFSWPLPQTDGIFGPLGRLHNTTLLLQYPPLLPAPTIPSLCSPFAYYMPHPNPWWLAGYIDRLSCSGEFSLIERCG